MATPAIAVYTVVVIYPAAAAVYYSLTNWSGLGAVRFTGLSNYRALFSSPESRQALVNTLILTAVTTAACVILGLALAVALQRRTRANIVLRLLWFLPAALPTIAAGYMWAFIYSPDGPLVRLWNAVLPFGAPGFLASQAGALWSIAVIVIWQSVGYSVIILIAGLEGIAPETIEAAVVDGAGAWRRFWRIKLPLLRQAIAICSVITIVNTMLVFGQVVATTNGGPGYATQTLATEIYSQAFMLSRYGYGMALGIAVAVLVCAAAGIVLWVIDPRDAR
jgi:raffinose/stachyose/melibiose transport system permease protein